MSRHRGSGPMPEGHDAIRVHVDEDEPPAVLFNDQARPGALVSWAWAQLAALDALLRPLAEERSSHVHDELVGAVRSTIVPVMNALEFSERRAHQLQGAPSPSPSPAAAAAPARRRKKKRGRPGTA